VHLPATRAFAIDTLENRARVALGGIIRFLLRPLGKAPSRREDTRPDCSFELERFHMLVSESLRAPCAPSIKMCEVKNVPHYASWSEASNTAFRDGYDGSLGIASERPCALAACEGGWQPGIPA
jgi:hypothetical protein